jgi:predicted nuclease of predicted toxin-antitoxin system
MFRLLIDQNFDHRILRGVRLWVSSLDVVLASDAGLATAEDPDLLEWAAAQSRVVVSHDLKTLVPFAYQRMAAGKRMPGVILVLASAPVGRAIDDILMILGCCREDELEGQVYIVPV